MANELRASDARYPRRDSLAGATVGSVGVGCVIAIGVAMSSSNGRLADGLLWLAYMFAFAAVGALLGLIFGVPRARAEFIPGQSERYSSNSNLEQISDWLTKLLVGAGLVELGSAGRSLGKLSTYLGAGMHVGNPAAFSLAAILYGSGIGFTGGYLWTRLRLRSLLEANDQRAAEISTQKEIVESLHLGTTMSEPESSLRAVAKSAVARVSSTAGTEYPPILWVDDYPANNTGIVSALATLGIDVEQVRSTFEALERIDRRVNYSLVISDLGRIEGGVDNPMAGADLLDALRERAVATPVIIFAGSRGKQNESLLLEKGARLVSQRATEVFDQAVRFATGSGPR